MSCSIVMENVSKTFLPEGIRLFLAGGKAGKAVDALKDVTLEVHEGDIFGLMGSNGAGKTTLLRILATLVLPTAGNAGVGGFDVGREGALVRKVIGYLPPDHRSFFWRLSGRENLAFYAVLNDVPRKIAIRRMEALARIFGLSDDLDAPVREYSTGMQRRLACIRLFMHDPSVVLLDEPTRSLDPRWRRAVWDYLGEWVKGKSGVSTGDLRERRAKRSVLVVTHDPEEARTLCNRVGFLGSGCLLRTGSYRELDEGGCLNGFAAPGLYSVVLQLSPFDFERMAEDFHRAWKGLELRVKRRGRLDDSTREERVELEISRGSRRIAAANLLLQWFLDRNVTIRSFHDATEDE